MIGLIAIAGVAVWLMMVIYLCKKIPLPRWLVKNPSIAKVARSFLFLILLILPITDELIGRWQFRKLCEREAVINLSLNWKSVKRARNASEPIVILNYYAIRIIEQPVKYIDLDANSPFLEYRGFHSSGGFLMDRLGFGLGTSISCWPPNDSQVLNLVNIDQLLKQGK